MAYVKHREITKSFSFSKILDKKSLPAYIKQYVQEDEVIWTAYKTTRDHGIFTNCKIVLFDNFGKMGMRKQIYAISYKSISMLSVVFDSTSAELHLLLDSGYPVRLKFVNMSGEDKLRLRILYTCINRVINNQMPSELDLKRLLLDEISFKN